jgi:DNA adenine methylase
MNIAQPFLRWAGSKRKLIPTLREFWDTSFDRYVEPFMGSACLFFALRPPRALLGDLNEELVATYETVRDEPEAISVRLQKFRRGKKSYYRLRRTNPRRLCRIEGAARFIFLNRFCFNGLYRTNLKGEFNVPYGGARTGDLPTTVQLLAISSVLKHAELRAADFSETLAATKNGDFVYLDPPFAVQHRRVFRQFGPRFFEIADLERLAACIELLDDRGVTFVLSYAYCKAAVNVFAKWEQRKITVHRNIAGFVQRRRTAMELLVSNLPAPEFYRAWK